MDLRSLTPYVVEVPDGVLDDLRGRLERARLDQTFPAGDWTYGTDHRYLADLLEYWREGYDWRVHERAINAFDHFRESIDGVLVHFVAQPGVGPEPLPLVMSHGWPWTFWDLRRVIGPLSDPAAYGGDPADAFDVVVPSLPGYGFSTPLTADGVNFWRTADLWHQLMTERLGVGRYAAQGGDWGAFVSAQLGHKYPDHVVGLHLHLLPWLEPGPMPGTDYPPEEQRWAERLLRHQLWGSGYSMQQFTRPATIGHALVDSPVALASWLVEKRQAWADNDGDIEAVFSKDDLCTMLTIYWVTASGGSAARYYTETRRNPWRPTSEVSPRVPVPTGVAVFPEELFKPSRSWAEGYFDLRRYAEMPRGGHFAPAEEPELLVAEIREFFRPLRDGGR
ncbi:epoxide hydrolase family protein [Nocardioides humi]|uniref:Epoxide hydrolase n=1 Tax=Nocardioides humi TaxID=449461 RepID=A0ABN2AEQ9_9ACTN|nr:epoxide hydrolase family protein [Nocardioides humi]